MEISEDILSVAYNTNSVSKERFQNMRTSVPAHRGDAISMLRVVALEMPVPLNANKAVLALVFLQNDVAGVAFATFSNEAFYHVPKGMYEELYMDYLGYFCLVVASDNNFKSGNILGRFKVSVNVVNELQAIREIELKFLMKQ
jgi:hypothetical protein